MQIALLNSHIALSDYSLCIIIKLQVIIATDTLLEINEMFYI